MLLRWHGVLSSGLLGFPVSSPCLTFQMISELLERMFWLQREGASRDVAAAGHVS